MFAVFSRQAMYVACAKNFHRVTQLPLDRCKTFVTDWTPPLKRIHAESPVNPKHKGFVDFACHTLIKTIISSKMWNSDALDRSMCINYIAGMERVLGSDHEIPYELRFDLDEQCVMEDLADPDEVNLAIDMARIYPGRMIFSSLSSSPPSNNKASKAPLLEGEMVINQGQYRDMADRLKLDGLKRVAPLPKGQLEPGQYSIRRSDDHTYTIRYCKPFSQKA